MQRFYKPIARIFTNAGAVAVGYKYYFYQTGTTTPVTTYQNEGATVANTNPVISDANGRFPEIWYSDLSQLKLIVKDSSDNIVAGEGADPVGASASAVSLNDFDVRPTSYWGLTTGTSTAFTLVANPTISAYANTQTFIIQFHLACGVNPTLAIDGLSAFNLKKYNSAGVKESLIAGDVQASSRYLGINDGVDIVILNPEYPSRYYANSTTARGFTYITSPITIAFNSVTSISFSAGNFNFSDGSGQAIATAMTKTLQSSGSWAAGTGQNGLDTGAKANSTWYHCYAIYNPATLVSDFLFSTGATTPTTLPSGYTKFKRLGSVRTDGSGNIIPFFQNRNYFFFKIPVLDFTGTSTTSLAALTLSTPLGIKTIAILTSTILALAGTAPVLRIFSADADDQAVSSGCWNGVYLGVSGSTVDVTTGGGNTLVSTSTSSHVFHRASISSGVSILTQGWIDNEIL